MRTLGIEDAARIARAAFEPLRCEIEVRRFGDGFSFRVYDGGDAVLRHELVPDTLASDPYALESLLEYTRRRLRERGYVLAAWSMGLPDHPG